MDRILNFITVHWRLLLAWLGLALLAYVLLFRGLTTLIPNYAPLEQASQQQSISLRTIYNNPVDAPYKSLVWIGHKMGHQSIAVTRIAAALIAATFALLFYWVAVHWYSKQVALLATILFVSSSGYLHFGRIGAAFILQMATIVLIACTFLLRKAKKERLMSYAIAAIFALCLYIPGMIWFELIGIVLMHRRILGIFRQLGANHSALLVLTGVIITIPLVIGAVRSPNVLLTVLGLPTSLPSLQLLFDNAMHLGSSVIFKGYWPPEYWLYGAPLLSAGEIILFIAGFILLFSRPRIRGNYLLFGMLAVSSVLIVLGGSAAMAMIIPLIYLTIAGGIYYLLDQWLRVFPKNPLARLAGMALLVVLVGSSTLYHIKAYYTAWPNAPETKAVYTINKPS
ncbi:hypothetical protein IPL85_04700 [Candidatus Saccharibacteria bacterium]|nr:MAG: hypothetical protein IPL85_04700 [Candidatus Saccharibacteria bacterium]